MWRIGVVTEVIKGNIDNNIRGVLVRLSNNSLLKFPVNKLYPFEYVQSNTQEPADKGKLRWRFAEWTMIKNIGPQCWVGSVRTAVRELLYYVIDICCFLSNRYKYFNQLERSPLDFLCHAILHSCSKSTWTNSCLESRRRSVSLLLTLNIFHTFS